MSITNILAAHTREWMKIPGVIGTGEGRQDSRPAIVIFVEKNTSDLRGTLPHEVEGFPVVIEETGSIKAY